MFKIRKGIFETNSSSVHTLCINKRDNIKAPENYTFCRGYEFGWAYEEYCDSESCGSYLYQILLSYAYEKGAEEWRTTELYLTKYKDDPDYKWYCPEDYPEYAAIIKKYEDEYKEQIENILRQYGCVNITWEGTLNTPTDHFRDGYIDHVDSAYGFLEDMINHPELLVSFLFGNSWIYTGNDNYGDDELPSEDVATGWDYVYEKDN